MSILHAFLHQSTSSMIHSKPNPISIDGMDGHTNNLQKHGIVKKCKQAPTTSRYASKHQRLRAMQASTILSIDSKHQRLGAMLQVSTNDFEQQCKQTPTKQCKQAPTTSSSPSSSSVSSCNILRSALPEAYTHKGFGVRF